MNRIKALRQKEGLSQKEFGDLFFVNQTAVSQWERDVTTPNSDTLKRIANRFNVSVDYLLQNDVQIVKKFEKPFRIPVLGCVQAGIPLEAIEEILDWEEIPESMAHDGEYFALQVSGDSMEPRIKEGDVVIVRKQETASSGDVAVVLVNGEDATVKRMLVNASGITLAPFNPAFDPIHYTPEEIVSLPVQIIGKVVELRAKFK